MDLGEISPAGNKRTDLSFQREGSELKQPFRLALSLKKMMI